MTTRPSIASRRLRSRWMLAAMATAAALVVAACAGDQPAATGSDDRPLVVATTSILADITANVVGDLARVEVIMDIDTDPHDFEPSARQVALLRDADVVVANGLDLEEGLVATLQAAADDGVTVLEVAPQVNPLARSDEPLLDNHSHEGDSDGHLDDGHLDDKPHGEEAGHEHGDEDPHFWMDPTRVALAAEVIASTVAANTTIDPDALEANTEAYTAELGELDAELAAQFATIAPEQRLLVTNHDAFGYLAERYGFTIVGTVIPTGSELAEPSASALAELAGLITELGVPAIFTENTSSPDLAETLAAEVGSAVSVVPLYSDSLGAPDSEAATYVMLMRTNGQRIADALRATGSSSGI